MLIFFLQSTLSEVLQHLYTYLILSQISLDLFMMYSLAISALSLPVCCSLFLCSQFLS